MQLMNMIRIQYKINELKLKNLINTTSDRLRQGKVPIKEYMSIQKFVVFYLPTKYIVLYIFHWPYKARLLNPTFEGKTWQERFGDNIKTYKLRENRMAN